MKKETVAEFLARGGKISKVPTPTQDVVVTVRKTTAGPAHLLSLGEADFMFGKPSNAKSTKISKEEHIDLSALPAALRSKYISRLKENVDAEGYEEEIDQLADEPEEDVDHCEECNVEHED